MSTHNGCFQEEIRKILCLFVCVEVLWPSQPNGIMSNAVSLPNHFYWADLILLTLVLLNPDIPYFANSVDPDQLASEEAN